jgi:hypothetical protein
MANSRNKLFAIKIRRQQRSQKLPTHYVNNNHVPDPNRNNSQKNLHTSRRAGLTANEAKRVSPWK